ncbi:hypothetical protein D3C77_720340 [compost metagenome]
MVIVKLPSACWVAPAHATLASLPLTRTSPSAPVVVTVEISPLSSGRPSVDFTTAYRSKDEEAFSVV